jgi:hypothetical protein
MRFMRRPRRFLLCAILSVVVLREPAGAANSEWKDHQGAIIRGEPVEVFGPFALFRTGPTTSRLLPMQVLPPDDCVRFYHAIAHRAPRAARWSDAKGEASREFIGHLRQSEKGKLHAFDFTSVPEPELILAIFVGRNSNAAAPHLLLDNLVPFVSRVQRIYSGPMAAIVCSTPGANFSLRPMPDSRTWLEAHEKTFVVFAPEKLAGAKGLARFASDSGFAMVLMTRDGVPLIGSEANEVRDVMKFVDDASNLLWELNAANPRGARNRLHYLRAVRPIEFAGGTTPPLLLIAPLKVDALRALGVVRIEADLEVGADGKTTAAELRPQSQLPPGLVSPITEALHRTIFLPAIDHGVAVPGKHRYELKIDPLDAKIAADAAWMNGEARVDVPLKSWLVLKAIKVPERDFLSKVQSVGADGTVRLTGVTVGDPNKISLAAQKSAFHSDWFAASGGPASVHPVAADKQLVDREKFAWKKMTPADGRVDFLEGASLSSFDYCIGYAWTEVEVAEDTDAWLGIGSDDGLKTWVNGELVIDQWVGRTSRLDDDVVALRLKKGKNAFLIKIQNSRGYWDFTARLRVRGT